MEIWLGSYLHRSCRGNRGGLGFLETPSWRTVGQQWGRVVLVWPYPSENIGMVFLSLASLSPVSSAAEPTGIGHHLRNRGVVSARCRRRFHDVDCSRRRMGLLIEVTFPITLIDPD